MKAKALYIKGIALAGWLTIPCCWGKIIFFCCFHWNWCLLGIVWFFFFFFYVPNMVWLLDWVVIMEVCFLNCPNRELGDLQVKLYLNWCHNCSIMTSSLWLFFKEWNYVSHSIKQKMHNGTQLFHNWRYFNIHYWKTF